MAAVVWILAAWLLWQHEVRLFYFDFYNTMQLTRIITLQVLKLGSFAFSGNISASNV